MPVSTLNPKSYSWPHPFPEQVAKNGTHWIPRGIQNRREQPDGQESWKKMHHIHALAWVKRTAGKCHYNKQKHTKKHKYTQACKFHPLPGFFLYPRLQIILHVQFAVNQALLNNPDMCGAENQPTSNDEMSLGWWRERQTHLPGSEAACCPLPPAHMQRCEHRSQKPPVFKGSFGWQGARGFTDRLSHKLSGFFRETIRPLFACVTEHIKDTEDEPDAGCTDLTEWWVYTFRILFCWGGGKLNVNNQGLKVPEMWQFLAAILIFAFIYWREKNCHTRGKLGRGRKIRSAAVYFATVLFLYYYHYSQSIFWRYLYFQSGFSPLRLRLRFPFYPVGEAGLMITAQRPLGIYRSLYPVNDTDKSGPSEAPAGCGDAQELIIPNLKLQLWVISTPEEIHHTRTTKK